jgi:hypothetical protein
VPSLTGRFPGRPLIVALCAASIAVAVAGCGGRSNLVATSPSPGPGTSAGAGTGTSGPAPAALPPSTKVSSPAYEAFVAHGLARIPGVPTEVIPQIIGCIIRKQLSQGITTVGAVAAHRTEVNADGVYCAHAAGLK